MSYVKKVIKGAGTIFLMSTLAALLGYLIRIILARNLPVSDYGLFFSIFTFINLFSIFKDLGLNITLTKFIPEYLVKNDYSRIKSTIVYVFFINFFSAGILCLIFILLAKFLSINYFRADSTSILVVLSLYFWLSVIVDICSMIFLGFQKTYYFALRPFLLNIFVFLFVILFIKKMGVFSVALAYLTSTIVISVLFLVLFLKVFPFFKYKLILSKELVKKIFYFGLPSMLTLIGGSVIGYIDTLILTYFRTLTEVGVYNVVLPTTLCLVTLGSSLANAVLPVVSEIWTRQMEEKIALGLKLVYKYSFLIILPLGLTVFAFPKIILKTFFGESYVVGSLAMQILIVGTVFYAVAVVNTGFLLGIGKPKVVTKIILIAAIFNLIGNLILIPLYGINGAAFSTALSYLIILVMSSLVLSKVVKVKIPLLSWSKILFNGIIFVLSIYFLKYFLKLNIYLEILLCITTATFIYLILGYILKLFSLKEIKWFLSIGSKN